MIERLFERIKNDTLITEVIYKQIVSALCSVGKQPFTGTLLVRYEPNEWLLEFESFDEYLKTFGEITLTIEELADRIFEGLEAELEPKRLIVELDAVTIVHGPAKAVRQRGYEKLIGKETMVEAIRELIAWGG